MTTRLGSKIFRGLYHLRMTVDDIPDIPALNSIPGHMPEESLELSDNMLSVQRRYLKTGIYQENKREKVMKAPIRKDTIQKEKNDSKCGNKQSNKKEECKMLKDKIIKIKKQRAVVPNILKTNYAENRYEFQVKPTSSPTKFVIRPDSHITNSPKMKLSKSVADKYMTYDKYDNDYLDEEDMCKQNQREISMIEPAKFNRSIKTLLPRVYGQWRNKPNSVENQSKLNLKDVTYAIASKHLRPDTPKPFASVSLPINFLGGNFKKRNLKKLRGNTHYKELHTGKASKYPA